LTEIASQAVGLPSPDPALIKRLCKTARYHGYAKHKAAPLAFGLAPYNKLRGDATLCDEHAGFTKEQSPRLFTVVFTRGLWTTGTRSIGQRPNGAKPCMVSRHE